MIAYLSSATYDARGYIASRTDFNGSITHYEHEARGLEIKRVEAFGTLDERTITTEWHPTFRLVTRTAEPLRITTYVYDDDGTTCGARGAMCRQTMQATTDAMGAQGFNATPTGNPRTVTYTYNSNGQVLTVDGTRTDVTDITTYAYYPSKELLPEVPVRRAPPLGL